MSGGLNVSVFIGYRVYLGGAEILRAAVTDAQGLHEAMAGAVELTVGDHLQALNSRSPNTDYYASAARGVETEASKERALIRIPKLGYPLRYYGGTVSPGKSISSHTGKLTTALALPTDDVPVVGPQDGRHRQRPADAGLLAFLPARNSTKSVGYLLEGEEKVITRGKRKGKTRIAIKPGGKLLYVLAKEAVHQADESVLPTNATMTEAAAGAVSDYLDGGDS